MSTVLPQLSIDWQTVRRVLIVRLRSIGDTVLATPSLIALRRFLPDARIDILLEDWVAPLLEGLEEVDNVIPIGKSSFERIKAGYELRRTGYDLAFNLHGGTTATFLTRASGARYRFGYSNYQYSFLYNRRLSSSYEFWKQEKTHSAEQQLALIGVAGVPVDDKPKSRLAVIPNALVSLRKKKFPSFDIDNAAFAMLHPAAAFQSKQWSVENFAGVAEYLHMNGLTAAAVASRNETPLLEALKTASSVPIVTFDDLSLPEITALASRARIFVGNDSGIAHIANAVGTPSVVIFGSSNRDHWRPWSDVPNELVYENFDCQPCAGYECERFGEPRCILSVPADKVTAAIDRVIKRSEAIKTTAKN